MGNLTVNLNEVFIDAFMGIVEECLTLEKGNLEIVLKGGRNSTKSQCAGSLLPLMMVKDRQQGIESSAACFLRYGNRLSERVVNCILFSLKLLHLDKMFRLRKSPLELVLLENGKETNQSIMFFGLDDVGNLKSVKSRSGNGFEYVWLEEYANNDDIGQSSIDNLLASCQRGISKSIVFFTYNPPRKRHTICDKFELPEGTNLIFYNDGKTYSEHVEYEIPGVDGTVTKKKIVNTSSYLDVIESGHANWLSSAFLVAAEEARTNNPAWYAYAFLGEIPGEEANVFNNIIEWDGQNFPEDTPAGIRKKFYRGQDYSNGGSDPHAGICLAIDMKHRRIFFMSEWGGDGKTLTIDGLAQMIKTYNKKFFTIWADSAQPLLSREINNRLPTPCMRSVKKWQGSVNAGILFLQSCTLYICKRITPEAYKEFSSLSFKIDKKTDTITSEIDTSSGDHWIDATRYALSETIAHEQI